MSAAAPAFSQTLIPSSIGAPCVSCDVTRASYALNPSWLFPTGKFQVLFGANFDGFQTGSLRSVGAVFSLRVGRAVSVAAAGLGGPARASPRCALGPLMQTGSLCTERRSWERGSPRGGLLPAEGALSTHRGAGGREAGAARGVGRRRSEEIPRRAAPSGGPTSGPQLQPGQPANVGARFWDGTKAPREEAGVPVNWLFRWGTGGKLKAKEAPVPVSGRLNRGPERWDVKVKKGDVGGGVQEGGGASRPGSSAHVWRRQSPGLEPCAHVTPREALRSECGSRPRVSPGKGRGTVLGESGRWGCCLKCVSSCL